MIITCNRPEAGAKRKSIEQGILEYQSEREKERKKKREERERKEGRKGRKEDLGRVRGNLSEKKKKVV